MSDNVFGQRMRTPPADLGDLSLLVETLPALDLDLPTMDDEIAKLLVIPVSQEVAPDFALIGYENVIRNIEEVLAQRGKQRNVLLYGPNGAGKTAILHGLVQRKERGELSTHMFKRTPLRLNNPRLLHMDDVAEITRQFDQVLESLGRFDVLVIENFYTLFTYLKAKGANAVMIGLLEALSRRKLQSIITCNTRERPLIMNDVPEVHELFAPIKINEPNSDAVLDILRGVHHSYESRYAIELPDATLCATRDITERYRNGLEGWAQPGRALILLDRAIAQFSVRMNSRSPELAALEAELVRIEYEVQSLTASNGTLHNPDRHAHLSARLAEIKPQVQTLRMQWIESTAPIKVLQTEKADLDKRLQGYSSRLRKLQEIRADTTSLMAAGTDPTKVGAEIATLNEMIATIRQLIREKDEALGKINLADVRDHVVTPGNIATTYSELSGIPTDQLNEDERERVLQMEEIMGERVFGQPQALRQLAVAVRREKAKLSADEPAPKGSFLFLGPSGCGKSETGKGLAWFQTGDEKNMVRVDMSEFMEKHSVSRLIGAPPGYAGYEDGGVLTNAVSAKPRSVVMLDEVEKAHPEVFKILLQVMDGGRLTDGKGETVDFRNTYLILTSNLGASHFIDDTIDFATAKQRAMKEVERFFAPEFIGRLDGVICFQRLQIPLLVRVAQRRFDQINRIINPDGLALEVPSEDIEQFCAAHEDPRYGARPILKAMKSTVEDELATAILQRRNGAGVFHGRYKGDGLLNIEFEPAHA